MSGVLLETRGLTRSFGGFCAVDGVDLDVPIGARLGIIGPNGAGKSTLFKLITGCLAPSSGRVLFAGKDITSHPEHRRARIGIAQTFQHSSVFDTLTCRETVLLVLQRRSGAGLRVRRRAAADVQAADILLERAGLAERRDAVAAALSHGERRQLEIAVALACEPHLLLLDEPSAGMSPAETLRLAELIESLPPELGVVLVEHDLEFVFRLVSHVAVLHLGQVIARGPADEIRDAPEVEEVYLGAATLEDLFIDDPGEAVIA